MSFKIGDKVEIISDKFKKKMNEKGIIEVNNIGVIEAIDENWLGIPYKVRITGSIVYWAYESELILEKESAISEKKTEIEILKKKLAYAEKELSELSGVEVVNDNDNDEKNQLIKYLKDRLKHAEQRVKEIKLRHGDNPGKTHTYHGGWDLGYWEGKVSTYQNLLDKLEG